MTAVLIAGATGAVGSRVLEMALADPRLERVVAPTRRPLTTTTPELINPVVDFADLDPTDEWWQVDAVVCALGTTRKEAGTAAAFRHVDHALPVRIGELTRAAGATAYGLVSSVGADATSRNLYLRTKGEAESDLAALGFDSLTIVRPSALLGGRRTRTTTLGDRLGEASRHVAPLLPARVRPVHVDQVAAALLEAIARPRPGIQVVVNASL
ncbi:NAD(P)H-binding protein [Nocardioides sp. AE5]|uniref:NAD(P)H-binding protein n=1 Tax=Nocardioides sp. AE5 TaxID=2962573 RepID=UPI0028818BB8|nr:NAD(P)H-binding protein [Nocardioides sp. AE5]MDT0200849.1 NAD(P)H-binding protein [Nocardioides sp. AE5]